MLLSLINPGIVFLKDNFQIILIVLISLVVFLLAFRLTSYSLGKLKSEIISYYPFDRIFPKSGHWSVLYFLITIVLLGVLVFAIIRGGFYMAPA